MLINSGHGCSGEQRDRCRKYQGNQENASISPSISSARCRPEVFHRPPRHGCSDPPGPCPPLTAGPGPLPRGATATAQWCGRAAPRPKHRRNVPGAGANPRAVFRLRTPPCPAPQAAPGNPAGAPRSAASLPPQTRGLQATKRPLHPPRAAPGAAGSGPGPLPSAGPAPAPKAAGLPLRALPARPCLPAAAPAPPQGLSRRPARAPPLTWRGRLRRALSAPRPSRPVPAAASATATAAAPSGNQPAPPITARRDVNAPRSHPDPSPR